MAEDVKGRLKINDVGMVIDTEENSDDDSDDSDDDEKINTPHEISGEMEYEDKEIKGEVFAGMYPEGRKRRGVRGHTNRKNPRKPTMRWSDLQKKTKERKGVEEAEAEEKATIEKAEAEAKAAAEAKPTEQKEEKKGSGLSNAKEKAPRAPKTERIVIDKEYLGYVMAIPKDEQISD